VALVCVLAACGPGDAASDGPTGISREEYCAMGSPVITRVTAEQQQSSVVVRWRELFGSLDERNFRVYRRSGPDAQWSRVAEVELPSGNGGSWRDTAPLAADTAEYGVTQVGECGEGRLCAGTGPAQQCSVAAVARRER
jgi:hypothetical protein